LKNISVKHRATLALSLVILCGPSYTAAWAQISGKERLEQKLHEKLDRILTPDEYLIDLSVKQNADEGNGLDGQYLPGLQVLGAVKQGTFGSGSDAIVLSGKAELFVIFDRSVSQERVRVAQDLIGRVIAAENLKSTVKVSSAQRDISKKPEAEAPPPPPPKDPTFIEELIKQKDFIIRALLVIWGTLVSLMAVYFVLRRVLLSTIADRPNHDANERYNKAPIRSQADSAPPAAKSEREAKSREELYSKDEAALALIKEIAEEAKEQPAKVARILSKWVSQSEEQSRQASVFLKNCDIRTVEAVCKSLHPSDLEKIIAHKIEDFEPFGIENQRVIDRMRGDFAILASEHLLKDKPDPLKFLRVLSNDDIHLILEDESDLTIALIATQIPAHRLQKFYELSSPDKIASVLSQISTVKATTLEDFEGIKEKLMEKAETLSLSMFSEKDRVHSIHHMITNVPSPKLQVDLLEKLNLENPSVYARVRPELFVAPDLRFLSGRVKSLIIQAVDADTLGAALSEFDLSFQEFIEGLTPAYQSIFNDAQNKVYDPSAVASSWKTVMQGFNELTLSGLLTKLEISSTIQRAIDHASSKKDKTVEPEAGDDGKDLISAA
jgi:hypothetical protein